MRRHLLLPGWFVNLDVFLDLDKLCIFYIDLSFVFEVPESYYK